MSERVAVYAGSFDPPTNGHLNIIERGRMLVDRLVVAVGVNPKKAGYFPVDERIRLLAETLGAPGVASDGTAVEPQGGRRVVDGSLEVRSFSGLLVDFCDAVGATVILRGLRGASDFDFELQLGLANRDLSPHIESVFLLTDPATIFVSSSIVKEIAGGGRSVAAYVPAAVDVALRKRSAAHTDPT